MGIIFDIHRAPPTATDIAVAHTQLLQKETVIDREDWKAFFLTIGVLFTLAAIAISLAPKLLKEGYNPTFAAAFILATPYIMFFAFATSSTYRHQRVEVPRKDVRSALASLTELSPEEVEIVVAWGQENAAIAAYHAKVAAQGRLLVLGEAEAMRESFHSFVAA